MVVAAGLNMIKNCPFARDLTASGIYREWPPHREKHSMSGSQVEQHGLDGVGGQRSEMGGRDRLDTTARQE